MATISKTKRWPNWQGVPRMKKTQDQPFYTLIDNQMASCHIVNEARAASVRPLITTRPFTPLPTHRRLFGGTQKTNRPPSAFTLDGVCYQQCPAPPPAAQPRRLPAIKGPDETDQCQDLLIEEVFQSKIQPLLDLINSQQPDEVTEDQVKSLAEVVDENFRGKTGQKCPQRSQILKSTFRLLSSKTPTVLLQSAKLLISMEIGKRNRGPLAKVVFCLAKDEINDQHFVQQNFSEPLLRLVKLMEPIEEWEALTYALGALKLLSTNLLLLQQLSKAGAVITMANLLQTILPQGLGRCLEEMGHILFQLTGGLRNMADISSNRHQFVKSGAVAHVVAILNGPYAHDVDVTLNVARILSKLTMYYEICNYLTESCEECFTSATGLLSSLGHEGEVTVRLCFALGNITAKNERAREILFHKANIVPTLLRLIDDRTASTAPIRRHQTELLNFSREAETELELSLNEEVEIKAIGLLANMSISPQVGPQLASNPHLFHRLLDRITSKQDELSLSSLSALSNLSYYYSATNQLFSTTNLTSSIKFIAVQLNSSSNQQLLSECLRFASNISRGEGLRKLLSLSKVGTMTLRLMTEERLNKDVIFLCCGLLVNLMAEENTRTDVRKENGVDSFVQVLSKSADDGDWQLAGVVCQLLWNYLAYSSPSQNSPSALSQPLLSLLQRHLSLTAASDHDLWKLEFCPVAWRLHARVHQTEAIEQK